MNPSLSKILDSILTPTQLQATSIILELFKPIIYQILSLLQYHFSLALNIPKTIIIFNRTNFPTRIFTTLIKSPHQPRRTTNNNFLEFNTIKKRLFKLLNIKITFKKYNLSKTRTFLIQISIRTGSIPHSIPSLKLTSLKQS